jgi:uncharacterized protein YidB (DUF937 family)
MSRGFPSMTALLGLLAIAGYQNRDKIAAMLGGASSTKPGGAAPGSRPAGLDGILGNLSSSLGGASVGSVLGGGLSELVNRFNQAGHTETVNSWVGTGPNKDIAPHQLEQAIGPDILDALSRQTGLSQGELLARLSRELPRAVDQYTPHGRLPTEADFSRN